MGKLGEPVMRMGTPVWSIDGYDVWNPAEMVFIISLGGDPQFVARTLVEATEWVGRKVDAVREAQRQLAATAKRLQRDVTVKPLAVLQRRTHR